MQLRVRGEGDAGTKGGSPGDLYVHIYVKPHEFFIRSQDDIIYQMPVNFVQAALGAELEIPTIDGKTKLKIPPGSQTGKVFRLKGQGVQRLNSPGRGDQLVQMVVVTPESLNEAQKKLLRELGESLNQGNMPQLAKMKSLLEEFKNVFGGA